MHSRDPAPWSLPDLVRRLGARLLRDPSPHLPLELAARSALGLVGRLRPCRPLPSEVASICALSLDRLGDLVRNTSLLLALKRAWPEAEIDLVVGPWSRGLGPCLPVPHCLHVVEPSWHREGRPWPVGLPAAIHRLRRRRYDLGLGLRFGEPWESFLLSCLRCRHRVGVDSGMAGFGLDRRVPYLPGEGPETAPRERFLEALGLEPVLPAPRLVVPAGARRRAESWLATRPKPWIAVHPGASHPSRRLPLESLRELLRRLEALGTTVLLGPRDEPPTSAGVDLRGRTDLPELAAVLSLADLVLTMDSGPAHVAAALGKHPIVLYGPSDPRVTAPRGATPLGMARLLEPEGWGEVLRRIQLEGNLDKLEACAIVSNIAADISQQGRGTHDTHPRRRNGNDR